MLFHGSVPNILCLRTPDVIQRLLLVFTHYENVSGNMFVVKNIKELFPNQPLEIGGWFFSVLDNL
jgi:hypothetical protein